jgi:lipid-binding SYLF domain-containing protein
MNSKFGQSAVATLCVGVVFCLAAAPTPAQSYAQYYSQPSLIQAEAVNDDEQENALEASANAAEVFHNIAVAQNEIPQDVLQSAAAVGVFKGIFNMAFIDGHRQGNGAITVRTPSGWSAPVFYKLRGGFSLGADASPANYLLVFMSRESIREISQGEFDLDHDANALAGPITEGTAFPQSKTVYVYSRARGSLAGAVINGARLTARDSVNLDLYGADALALLSDPLQLADIRANHIAPSVSHSRDLPGAALDPQPAYMPAMPPRFTIRENLASNASAWPQRHRGVKVIVIKIINEDEDDEDGEDDKCDEDAQVMAVCPQVVQQAPAVNCCPRIHKKKL